MLGQVLGGLADAVPGARLRQHQREIGRREQCARRLAIGADGFEQLEDRLRADDAVIVLDLVGELQRAARLAFRILGERDRRRLVGDGGELPGHVVGAEAAHADGARVVDDETALLGAPLSATVCAPGFGIADPAARDDVEMDAGGADDQRAARRHRERGGGRQRLARPQARQDHRRLAGVGRRRHPGVDAEIGRRHHALPIEGRGDAFHPLAAGGEERRDHQHRHQRRAAQRDRALQRAARA